MTTASVFYTLKCILYSRKDQLLCPDVQAQAEKKCNELKLFLRTLSAKNKTGEFGSKTQKRT